MRLKALLVMIVGSTPLSLTASDEIPPRTLQPGFELILPSKANLTNQASAYSAVLQSEDLLFIAGDRVPLLVYRHREGNWQRVLTLDDRDITSQSIVDLSWDGQKLTLVARRSVLEVAINVENGTTSSFSSRRFPDSSHNLGSFRLIRSDTTNGFYLYGRRFSTGTIFYYPPTSAGSTDPVLVWRSSFQDRSNSFDAALSHDGSLLAVSDADDEGSPTVSLIELSTETGLSTGRLRSIQQPEDFRRVSFGLQLDFSESGELLITDRKVEANEIVISRYDAQRLLEEDPAPNQTFATGLRPSNRSNSYETTVTSDNLLLIAPLSPVAPLGSQERGIYEISFENGEVREKDLPNALTLTKTFIRPLLGENNVLIRKAKTDGSSVRITTLEPFAGEVDLLSRKSFSSFDNGGVERRLLLTLEGNSLIADPVAPQPVDQPSGQVVFVDKRKRITQTIESPTRVTSGRSSAHFGTQISIDEDTLFIAETPRTTSEFREGKVHLYERTENGNWIYQRTALPNRQNEFSAYSADLRGATLVARSEDRGRLIYTPDLRQELNSQVIDVSNLLSDNSIRSFRFSLSEVGLFVLYRSIVGENHTVGIALFESEDNRLNLVAQNRTLYSGSQFPSLRLFEAPGGAVAAIGTPRGRSQQTSWQLTRVALQDELTVLESETYLSETSALRVFERGRDSAFYDPVSGLIRSIVSAGSMFDLFLEQGLVVSLISDSGGLHYTYENTSNSSQSRLAYRRAESEPLSSFQDWRLDNFGTPFQRTALESVNSADPDEDGIANIEEYAFSSDPNLKNKRPEVLKFLRDGEGLGLGFDSPEELNQGIRIVVQSSSDLIEWENIYQIPRDQNPINPLNFQRTRNAETRYRAEIAGEGPNFFRYFVTER